MREILPVLCEGKRLDVLIDLILRANIRLRCYPGVRKIAKDIGATNTPTSDAKQWLEEHGAFVLVPYSKRVDEELKLPPKQHVYQLTGVIQLEGKSYQYLYMTPEALSAIQVVVADVLKTRTSMFQNLEVLKTGTEVDTSSFKDKSNSFASDDATDGTPSLSKSKRNKTDRVPAEKMTPMKDAIFAAFGHTSWDTLTDSERGVIQKSARELILAGFTPADVAGLYDYCAEQFDKFSPRALCTNASDARKEGYLDTPAASTSDEPATTSTAASDDDAARAAARERSRSRFSHMRQGASHDHTATA